MFQRGLPHFFAFTVLIALCFCLSTVSHAKSVRSHDSTRQYEVKSVSIRLRNPPAKSKPAVALDGAKTLDDVLAAEEALQRFLSIADSLGMRDIFAETEDITVLAVSNEVELAAWEAEIAADPDPSKYIDRMKRHILTESMPFDAMSNVQPVPTMSEEILVISHRDGGRIVVYDDDTYELAQIVRTDLEGSNGFVHIVDRVLVRHADVLRP